MFLINRRMIDPNNNIPDWWLIEHFGSSTVDVANVDSDGDGHINQHEFWLGTDPSCALPSSVISIELPISKVALRSISVKFGTAGKGPLGKMVYGEGGVGHHLRIFTMAGLKDMMQLHGYKLVYSKGVRTFCWSKRKGLAGFMLNCAALIDGIASLCSGLACNIVCIGQKKKNS